MATKQKTTEDYRNAVKLLKLKCIKLQKQNDELQDKLREQGIPVIEDPRTAGPMTNQNVMVAYSRGCKRVGLTPEMLYRASDVDGQCAIKVEEFRLFLSKVRLGLNTAQITILCRMIDENYTGIVKKEGNKYYDCLSAYAINEEKSGSSSRTYGQESLIKFTRLLLLARISPEDSWAKMDPQGRGTIIPTTFSSFTHALDQEQKMNEKEIVAVFNHIDLDRQGTLQKTFYDQEVRKAMKACAQDMGMASAATNLFNGSQGFTQNGSTGHNRVEAQQNQGMDVSRVIEQPKLVFSGDMKAIMAIAQKLESQGVKLIPFISDMMKSMSNPSAGIMLYDVYRGFDQLGSKVPKSDQLRLFQLLDMGSNGSIDYDELMVFYWEMKKPQDTYDGLFEILTRKLQAQQIDIAQYLGIEQIQEGDELDPEKFHQTAETLFMVTSREHSDGLFRAMDQDGAGVLSATEIIMAIRRTMDIYCPPKPTLLDSFMQQSTLDQNVDEYFNLLKKMKPRLNDEDYFDRFQMKGKRIEMRKWKTIFNSDLACLRYCYEQLFQLKKNVGSKWLDPEFGPTPQDEYGSKSMYFADNDIPEGCPDPKECKWLRPEQIIAEMIENGNEDLVGKVAEVFDSNGAGVNDVCQSKYLGNCWFVSALSIIARYDKYLKGQFDITNESATDLSDEEVRGMQVGVYPPCFQFLKKYGIYVMRFYKNFGWRYVVIDDRLCMKDGEFVYGHTRQPTEIWVNLIEKAYAKLHNCYCALTSGDIAQGLADMTGLVADKTRLDNAALVSPAEKDALWNQLVQAKADGSMMGCSAEGETETYIEIKGEDSGIMSGHAYGIIDVFEIPDDKCLNYHKSHRLLKVRNPWGYGEWKLKWSENPDNIQKLDAFLPQIKNYDESEIKKANEAGIEPPESYKYGIDDGTFLMCFKDWRTTFCNLFLCIDFPNDWMGLRQVDRFGSSTSGVPKNMESSKLAYAQKNPQYIIDINRKDGQSTKLYIQMTQLDGRLFWSEKYPYSNVMKFILLCVFRLEKGEISLPKFDPSRMIASSKKIQLRREVDTNDFELPNGRYAIVPCTANPGDYCQYAINVYFNCQNEDIKLSKFGDSKFKFNIIAEEEEKVSKASDELKKLLKKQAFDVINAQ